MPKHAIADDRRRAIVEQLVENPVVMVSDLSDRYGVSEVAIRRDLGSLEDRGLLRRIHGGAVAVPTTTPANGPSEHKCFLSGSAAQSETKHRIARAAAGLVRSGERVIFDSGDTVLPLWGRAGCHAGVLLASRGRDRSLRHGDRGRRYSGSTAVP